MSEPHRPIFESEEEAIEVLKHVFIFGNIERKWEEIVSVDTTLYTWKNNGYIRRNPVEEAEEMYTQWMFKSRDGMTCDMVIKQLYEAIQYLKNKSGETK